MSLQQQQLDELAEWLTRMEERVSVEKKLGSDLSQVKQQIEDHKKLQEELDQQQKKVDSLQNMVVVVDDNNTESGRNYTRFGMKNCGLFEKSENKSSKFLVVLFAKQLSL